MATALDIPCPDVMPLDLNLPKVDGPTILEDFRTHPACQHTPVIVVTPSDAKRDGAEIATYGPTRRLRKPSDIDAFMQLDALIRQSDC